MYRIIDDRGTGKTGKLMELAEQTGAVIACINPFAMKQKAYSYGITNIEFISYKDVFDYRHKSPDVEIYIDELEVFVNSFLFGHLKGYTLSLEDKIKYE